MVNYSMRQSASQIDDIFMALADPTRRNILERLSTEKLTITEIAQPHDMSLPAISKHIKVLEKAQLVSRKKHGREYTIQLEPDTLRTAAEYIAFYKKFWSIQLDNLENFLMGGEKHDKK